MIRFTGRLAASLSLLALAGLSACGDRGSSETQGSAMGGALFLAGALLMVWNLWQTVNAKQAEPAAAPALVPAE